MSGDRSHEAQSLPSLAVQGRRTDIVRGVHNDNVHPATRLALDIRLSRHNDADIDDILGPLQQSACTISAGLHRLHPIRLHVSKQHENRRYEDLRVSGSEGFLQRLRREGRSDADHGDSGVAAGRTQSDPLSDVSIGELRPHLRSQEVPRTPGTSVSPGSRRSGFSPAGYGLSGFPSSQQRQVLGYSPRDLCADALINASRKPSQVRFLERRESSIFHCRGTDTCPRTHGRARVPKNLIDHQYLIDRFFIALVRRSEDLAGYTLCRPLSVTFLYL